MDTRRRRRRGNPEWWPPGVVNVLVAAHNEEEPIERTVRIILSYARPDRPLELVVVNDASTDRTEQILDKLTSEFTASWQRLVVVHKRQGGSKSRALNYALFKGFIRGAVTVFMDADTLPDEHTFPELVHPFADPKVAAVTGRVAVNNYGRGLRQQWLTRWQEQDYATGMLTRQAQAVLHDPLIVSGACCAWRTADLVAAGGFWSDTFAEDFDTGVLVRYKELHVVHTARAVGFTEVPMSLGVLWRQRLRWFFGIWQVLWKHKREIFPRPGKYGWLWFFMTYSAVNSLIPMAILPLNYLLSALAIATGNWRMVAVYWTLFMVVQVALSTAAMLALRDWSWRGLAVAVFYRVLNDPLQFCLAWRSLYHAVTGRPVRWNRPPRAPVAGQGKLRVKPIERAQAPGQEPELLNI